MDLEYLNIVKHSRDSELENFSYMDGRCKLSIWKWLELMKPLIGD